MDNKPLEQDLYRRAFNVLRDAMLVMSSYTGRDMEQYLVDHGYSRHILSRMRDNMSEWEYLRRLDYEICETVVKHADEIISGTFQP